MLVKSGLFLFLLTVLQVSARYKSVEPDFIENEILPEPLLSSSSRIVSGWPAEQGQFPYHAALRFEAFVGPDGRVERYCGGSIVSNEWVVTSAFCTISTLFNFIRATVYAGGVNFTDSEYIAITTEWYNHPLFQASRPEPQSNDIALVKLQQPVVYTRFVQPIRIQSKSDAYRNYDGQQVIAAGNGDTGNWGTSATIYEALRWVYLRGISNNECSRLYSYDFSDTTICAQYFNATSQATCYGDTGGPLVHVDSDGVPTLIGVSLFLTVGCRRNLPSGFIRPGHFLPWFQEVTGINFDQEDTTITPNTSTTTTTTTTTLTTTTTPTTPITPTTTTIPITTTTPTTNTTTTTPTTPDITTTSTTTTIPYTQSTPTTTTTDSEKPDDPDGVTPEDNTVAPPEDSEDKEDDKENDSDCSESNENDEMGQLMKRLQVDVKVKVKFDKYNLTNAVGNEIVAKH